MVVPVSVACGCMCACICECALGVCCHSYRIEVRECPCRVWVPWDVQPLDPLLQETGHPTHFQISPLFQAIPLMFTCCVRNLLIIPSIDLFVFHMFPDRFLLARPHFLLIDFSFLFKSDCMKSSTDAQFQHFHV